VLDARRLRQQLVGTTEECSRDGAVQMRRAPRLTREHVEDPERSLAEPDGKPRDCLRLVVYERQSTLEELRQLVLAPGLCPSRTSSPTVTILASFSCVFLSIAAPTPSRSS